VNPLQQFLALVRRSVFATVCIVLALGFGIASYLLWQRQQELTVGHDSVRRNGEDMLLSLSGLPRVSAELASVKEATDFIDGNLIRQGDLAENLGYFYQLETVSKVHLMQLNQLTAQPTAADAPYIAVPFSVRATGSYRQVMRFIRELETGPRLCRIQTFMLTGGAEDKIQLDLSLEMLGHP
jgi:Tfp pilus assembly protein PilO